MQNKFVHFRKICFYLLCASGLFWQPVFCQHAEIKVLTYNIRYDNPQDGENAWTLRSERVITLIRDASPDVFGLQEVLKSQVDALKKAFPAYGFIGVGRDDGKDTGEFAPIFYQIYRYQPVASGVFWLSQTPTIAGSRGWDAACNRIVTWVGLKEKSTGRVFYTFCTHFDHIGEIARRNSSLLLLHAVDSLAGKNPAVIVGDFNATPDNEPYKIITNNNNPLHLIDSKNVAKSYKGTDYTYTGFQVGGIPGERIDYIFIKNIPEVELLEVNPINDGKYYPSDHLPVSAQIRLW